MLAGWEEVPAVGCNRLVKVRQEEVLTSEPVYDRQQYGIRASDAAECTTLATVSVEQMNIVDGLRGGRHASSDGTVAN